MKHKYNHLLAGYWAGIYSQAERVELEDAVFSAITPSLFVAFSDSRDELNIVAAGSQLKKALGPIVGRTLFSLFSISERPLIRKVLNLSRLKNEPICFTALANQYDGNECGLEISLFPIRQRDETVICYMGLMMQLQDISEVGISLPLKLIMSQELSDILTSEMGDDGAKIVPFRAKST